MIPNIVNEREHTLWKQCIANEKKEWRALSGLLSMTRNLMHHANDERKHLLETEGRLKEEYSRTKVLSFIKERFEYVVEDTVIACVRSAEEGNSHGVQYVLKQLFL